MAKVLVVADVAENARSLAAELTRQGYAVEVAASEAEALDKAASDPPDAILLDLEAAGLAACRRLKADPALETIPLMVIAAPDVERRIAAFLDAGADDYLSRRDDACALLARLQIALRTKSARDMLRETNRCLEETRRMAEAANAAKGEFLANVSHELRSPMTAILGFADLLHDKLADEDERATLDTIKRNGELLLRMVDDLLDLSKLEAGMFTVETGPCSPRAVVNEVVALLKRRALDKGLSLEAACESSLPDLIRSDSLRLRQIVANLVTNAIKFTEQGGVLIRLWSARAEAVESTLQLEVADTGMGIEAERIDAIFDPYVQVDASVARRYGGTGLGLAISRRLARLLGGDLTVASEPGVGSTFRLTLPLSPPY
ncbi:MAG TPA: ATP-binding protein [Pirellulales bacterium]|nr:ATP-binding protein [Pirellulales bacterium]